MTTNSRLHVRGDNHEVSIQRHIREYQQHESLGPGFLCNEGFNHELGHTTLYKCLGKNLSSSKMLRSKYLLVIHFLGLGHFKEMF